MDIASPRWRQIGVRHSSMQVWCAAREQPAVISVIERGNATATACFVLWCSLRGCGHCEERCLRELSDPSPV